MIYKETYDLINMMFGDALVMNDGSVHEAVRDDIPYAELNCKMCSMNIISDCIVHDVRCYDFHFKQIKR